MPKKTQLMFPIFILFLTSCAVSVPDYRVNGKDVFIMVCHTQSFLGHTTYNFELDPVNKIAIMKRIPHIARGETLQLLEAVQFTPEHVHFYTTSDKAASETALYSINKDSQKLTDSNNNVIAKRCDDVSSSKHSTLLQKQFSDIKNSWYKVSDNMYQSPQ